VSSNRLTASGLEGRYAMALFQLALEKKALDTVASDIIKLAKLVEQSEDFSALLKNPVLDQDTKAKAVAAVAKKAKLHKLTANFLGVLVENRRLGYLSKIAASFLQIVADHRGEIKAEVISASRLTKTQADALKKKLKRRLGRDIAFEVTIDPGLLGGLRVKVGSRVIDNSLKTKLNNLTLAMKGV
jgi:F-type H+-transporting ATPase subunit delta